jgi:hypothetical protein
MAYPVCKLALDIITRDSGASAPPVAIALAKHLPSFLTALRRAAWTGRTSTALIA